MKRSFVFALSLIAVMLVGVSCKKKCTIPEEDTYSGSIVYEMNDKPVVIYPSAGGMIVPGGLIVHNGSSQPNKDKFEVSFDGGLTRQSVDFSQYTIMGYPLTVKCDAAIDRNVVIDDLNNIVTFSVKVQECDNGCDDLRSIENYVLVPAFDPNVYTVVYTVDQ